MQFQRGMSSKAGKNQDGYFDCDDLCRQTEVSIELFEDIFLGQQWLHLDLTMHLATKSGLLMHCPPATCPNSPKKWLGISGKYNSSKLRGSRVLLPWQPSWNARLVQWDEANLPAECKISSVQIRSQHVAAIGFCSINQNFLLRNWLLLNWLSLKVTWHFSIQTSTANSIS